MALFEAIGSLEKVRLRKLNLSHNNLANVPSQILAKAVLRLNEVQLVGWLIDMETLTKFVAGDHVPH